MQDLSPDQINELLDKCDWGTLLVIDGDKPYGIEVSHFIYNSAIYLIINPEGKAVSCIARNPNISYKVCKADLPQQKWSAAAVEGKVKRVTDPDKIYEFFLMLAQRLNRDMEKYKKMGKQFSGKPEASPVFYLEIKNISGKASHNGFYAG